MKVPKCLWVAQSLLFLDGSKVAANPVQVDKHVATHRSPGKTPGFLAGPSSRHSIAATEASPATTSGDDSTTFILTRLIPFMDNDTMHYSCRDDKDNAPVDLWHLVRPKADLFWSTESVWGTNFTYAYQSKLDKGVHRLSYIGRITGTNLAGEVSIMGREGVFKPDEGYVVPELTIAAVVPKDNISDLDSKVPEFLQNQFDMQLPNMMHNSSLSAVPVSAAAAPVAPLKTAMQEEFYSATNKGGKKKKPLVVLPVPIIIAANNPKPVVPPAVPGPGEVTPPQVPPAENPGVIPDPPAAPGPGGAPPPIEPPYQPFDPGHVTNEHQSPAEPEPEPVEQPPANPPPDPKPVDPGHATNEHPHPIELEPKPVEQPPANPPPDSKPAEHGPPSDPNPVHPEPGPGDPQPPKQPPSNPSHPDPPTQKPPPQDLPPKEIPAEHPPPSNPSHPDPPTEKPPPQDLPPKEIPAEHPPPSNPVHPDPKTEKIPPPEVQPPRVPPNPSFPNEAPEPVPERPIKPLEPLEPASPDLPPSNPQPPTEPYVKPVEVQPPKPELPALPDANLKPEEPLAPPPKAPPKDEIQMAKVEAAIKEAKQEVLNMDQVGIDPGDPKRLKDALKKSDEIKDEFVKKKAEFAEKHVTPEQMAKAEEHIESVEDLRSHLKAAKADVEETLVHNPRGKPKPQIKPTRPDDPTKVYVEEANDYFRKQDTIPGKNGESSKLKYSGKKWAVDTSHHLKGQLQPEPNAKLNGLGEYANLKFGDGRLMEEIPPEVANDQQFEPKKGKLREEHGKFRSEYGFDGTSDDGWWFPGKGKGPTDFFTGGEVPEDPIGMKGVDEVARGYKYNEMSEGGRALRNALVGTEVDVPLAITEVALSPTDSVLSEVFFFSRIVVEFTAEMVIAGVITEELLQGWARLRLRLARLG